jgi:hypothetical protein
VLLGLAVVLSRSQSRFSLWPTYDSALVIARSNVGGVFVGMNKPFWPPRIRMRPCFLTPDCLSM